MKNNQEGKTFCENRKARHEYTIVDTYEAGIALVGSEVKSIRAGRANIADSYIGNENGSLVLINAHISPNEQTGKVFQHEPTRRRMLLLNKKEINRILGAIEKDGATCVPLALYARNNRVKVKVAVVKGKKLHDKRAAIKERDTNREIQRAMRNYG
jgi:SsrA-binding protein